MVGELSRGAFSTSETSAFQSSLTIEEVTVRVHLEVTGVVPRPVRAGQLSLPLPIKLSSLFGRSGVTSLIKVFLRIGWLGLASLIEQFIRNVRLLVVPLLDILHDLLRVSGSPGLGSGKQLRVDQVQEMVGRFP